VPHGWAEVIDFAKKLRSDEHNDFALLASGLPLTFSIGCMLWAISTKAESS